MGRGGHGLIYDHMSGCRSDWSLRNEPPRVRECLGWARFHRLRDRSRLTELIRGEYDGVVESSTTTLPRKDSWVFSMIPHMQVGWGSVY